MTGDGRPSPGSDMRRIRITLAYDGTAYHGWQMQPEQATIQSALESALAEMEAAPVRVEGSGRTDAGVHALAQVAAFSLANPIPVENLRKAMNRLLPHDIRILTAGEAAPDFHPRFHAKQKTYEYRILRAETCPPFLRNYVYHHPYPLDETRMMELAPLLEGEHDFTAFAAADEKDDLGHSKVRTIFSSRLSSESSGQFVAGFAAGSVRANDLLIYRVTGSGFLKHMVRNIVGVLLEVGKGNVTREGLLARLEPNCAILRGPSVPARGLFLVSVEYGNPNVLGAIAT